MKTKEEIDKNLEKDNPPEVEAELIQPSWEYMKYLGDPNLLEIINKEFDKKIVGEVEARKSIFVIANMRNVGNLNKSSDNVIVNAISGTGKDFITEAVFDMIPSEEKEELIKTTPKVLSYERNRTRKGNENATWKKTALRLEDVSDNVINDDSFKVLLSSNPNKLNNGKTLIKQKVIKISIDGKPPIIMTIANPNIRDENLRRCPMLFLDESINQTKEILKRQAQFSQEGKIAEYNPILKESLKYLKRVPVKIPYADKLVKIFENSTQNVIIRTAFPRFLDYIKSSATLFQYQRQKDKNNFIIAVKQDYEIGALVLKKTINNIFMIPLTKNDKAIYDFFLNNKLKELSVDDLMDYQEIQSLGISDRWLRNRLDFLVSKKFLNRNSKFRDNSFKPVNLYFPNVLSEFIIPDFDTIMQEKGVFEVNEANSLKFANTQKIDFSKEDVQKSGLDPELIKKTIKDMNKMSSNASDASDTSNNSNASIT